MFKDEMLDKEDALTIIFLLSWSTKLTFFLTSGRQQGLHLLYMSKIAICGLWSSKQTHNHLCSEAKISHNNNNINNNNYYYYYYNYYYNHFIKVLEDLKVAVHKSCTNNWGNCKSKGKTIVIVTGNKIIIIIKVKLLNLLTIHNLSIDNNSNSFFVYLLGSSDWSWETKTIGVGKEEEGGIIKSQKYGTRYCQQFEI